MSNENQAIPYRFKLSFSQSLTSGIIALHGDLYVSDGENAKEIIDRLMVNAKYFESEFKRSGYNVAKEIILNRNGTVKKPDAKT